jgi:hypothetical protein
VLGELLLPHGRGGDDERGHHFWASSAVGGGGVVRILTPCFVSSVPLGVVSSIM